LTLLLGGDVAEDSLILPKQKPESIQLLKIIQPNQGENAVRKMWTKLSTTAALAFMLCLTGLVMSGEAQAQRFVDNGNGTVTDTVTGLMWTKDANPLGDLNHSEALPRIRSFSISGIGGWRLPSREELVALYHAIQGGHPFTGVRGWYYLVSVRKLYHIEFNSSFVNTRNKFCLSRSASTSLYLDI
jgi:hypothetical protein